MLVNLNTVVVLHIYFLVVVSCWCILLRTGIQLVVFLAACNGGAFPCLPATYLRTGGGLSYLLTILTYWW